MELTLADKIAFLQDQSNEIAFGWNDNGSFWHFRWGNRGSGSMIESIGETFAATETLGCSLEEAVDQLLAHRGYSEHAVALYKIKNRRDEPR